MRPSSDCGPERGPETSWSSTKSVLSFISTHLDGQNRFPNCEGSRDLQSLGLQLNITLEVIRKKLRRNSEVFKAS